MAAAAPVGGRLGAVLLGVALMAYGALVIGFLLYEPYGLAKIYSNVRTYLLVWPFRHAQR